MIDYEKLKEALNLASNLHERVSVEVCFFKHLVPTYNLNQKDGCGYSGDNIDEVIDKLKELTKPKPKYNVGETVFAKEYNEYISSFTIDEVVYEDGDYVYINYVDGGDFSDGENDFNQYIEDDVYPSKESLIDSQISYWQSFKEEEERETPSISYDELQKAKDFFRQVGKKIVENHLDEEKEELQLIEEGTRVFYSIDNRIHEGVIDSLVTNDEGQKMYYVNDVNDEMHEVLQKDLFLSKQDLLRADIFGEANKEFDAAVEEAFYASREEQKCEHESDGMIYTSNPPQNKCKHCGEYYR